ncbi:TetR/AcrR family transcriptional regulator [Clostridium beijerinckii]|jgi:Transcriptional regulator|uniref:TetR/AcrR family transcriptional regulator n=2 Tax=Clostridium beijerinckii TaxID=1520 RepID=A0AAE2RNQ3_CLOBE|nr:TetR/AcrR family transcriptional regulator [Clostridium beijerinckii]ABR32448.1 transcriptional regulator, TetR family [Clostridium beijerinckii NCIMB 8052]AIU03680.1 TetR family transcriptional regulator [Clostridium beijerinckii ATCC 35702]MBF7807874.1 TetR/AcrR family transcriptional regulator [Clostridium beijerinckii]NRT26329.1 AcrR family transcriptional regulator [Clostridium beijerinckii]NRT66064.1 AcrR family transcriptional regulator [Clostridium beijerinckii]
MELNKAIRIPKQKRSIITNEKIIKTAFKLFCEKGYYKTTTNEIAKIAGVSIGSFYSYYKDKDTIFMKILDDYNKLFLEINNESELAINLYKSDKKKWLQKLINKILNIHESSKQLNKEIKILSYSMPEIAEINKKHHEIIIKVILEYLHMCKNDIKISDLYVASIISYNIISSTVDHIAFEETIISRERLIEATVEAVYKFLFK